MKYRLGVDIGGTSVKIAALDSELKLTEKRRFPTGESCTSEEIMQNLIEHCREFIEKYDVEAIGVGSAGGIDPKKGLVVTAGNLPFRNEPVVQKLHDAFGIPVFIDNDGNCALVGERAVGECKGCVDTLILTLGTGVGGAVIMDNRIMRGRNNRAGELGHFILDRNGVDCECGLRGCFERYASATALIEMTEKKKIGLSLPSLRIDNFSLELMEKVRHKGLTFAPEAGTQRLRDVINKNITEDDRG